MKYYIDTEFIEYPNTIDLISIGIKCEDGRTFYAESTEFDLSKASDWVKEKVISHLYFYNKDTVLANLLLSDMDLVVFANLKTIKNKIIEFIGNDIPEFWGYYADYDWVVFCWLFGSMIDLPEGWPMYCKDLKQLLDESGKAEFPKPVDEHNALSDAIWNEKLHQYLLKNKIKLDLKGIN